MRTRLPTKPNTHSGSAATCTLQTVLLALGKWLLGSATLEPLADQAKTRLQCFMMVRVWTERESKLENTCVLLPPSVCTFFFYRRGNGSVFLRGVARVGLVN